MCSTDLSEDLSTALACLRDRVLKGAPRLVLAMRRNKFLVSADAYRDEGGEGVGGILCGPNVLVVAGLVNGCCQRISNASLNLPCCVRYPVQ